MSLKITISINREPIEEIVILRGEDFRGSEEVHRYRVWYDHEVIFMDHLYSDGALILAQKALTLVNESLS